MKRLTIQQTESTPVLFRWPFRRSDARHSCLSRINFKGQQWSPLKHNMVTTKSTGIHEESVKSPTSSSRANKKSHNCRNTSYLPTPGSHALVPGDPVEKSVEQSPCRSSKNKNLSKRKPSDRRNKLEVRGKTENPKSPQSSPKSKDE